MSDEEQAVLDENMPPIDVETTEVETTEVEATESAPGAEKGEFVETENDKVQARINQITAEKYAERRERERLQAENETLRAQAPAKPAEPTGEPRLEDFDFDPDRHQAALIDYKVEAKAREIQTQQEAMAQQQTAADRQATFNVKAQELRGSAEDYDDVISAIPQLPEQTLSAVISAENGPELAYYLGKHLDVADELSRLDPVQAGIKLGIITAQLSAVKPEIKPSTAPDPIEPISASGTLTKSMEDMSMEEIYALED